MLESESETMIRLSGAERERVNQLLLYRQSSEILVWDPHVALL